MPFEIFDYFVLQVFIQAVVVATAFLVCFNVILAIYAWLTSITNSFKEVP
jgi:hypothetical protein